MDLELSPDQRELRDVARAFVDEHAPLSLARAFLEGDGDASALRSAVAEMGWYGVGLDDDPFGVPGLCLLAQQVGRRAAPLALVDTAIAVRLLTATPDSGADRWIESIVTGAVSAGLALRADGHSWGGLVDNELSREDDGSWRISGNRVGIAHGGDADVFVVASRFEGDPLLLVIPRTTEGLEVQSTPDLDAAAAPARIAFDQVRVAAEDAFIVEPFAWASVFAVGAVATAAEAIGAADAALDMACQYARERRQFGRPIGQFQALQHLLADLHVQRETAWATTLYAAALLEEEAPAAIESASVAKAHSSRAARTIVEGSLQAMGGVGFTWEHDLHLLHRRVLRSERSFGDAAEHERRLADLLAGRAAIVLEEASGTV
jgi:alkylation response protein AidB-like acyl-CoA dehydrogenase